MLSWFSLCNWWTRHIVYLWMDYRYCDVTSLQFMIVSKEPNVIWLNSNVWPIRTLDSHLRLTNLFRNGIRHKTQRPCWSWGERPIVSGACWRQGAVDPLEGNTITVDTGTRAHNPQPKRVSQDLSACQRKGRWERFCESYLILYLANYLTQLSLVYVVVVVVLGLSNCLHMKWSQGGSVEGGGGGVGSHFLSPWWELVHY